MRENPSAPPGGGAPHGQGADLGDRNKPAAAAPGRLVRSDALEIFAGPANPVLLLLPTAAAALPLAALERRRPPLAIGH